MEAIVYRHRTGIPWRDLPARFGSWKTVWARHRHWATDGTWDRVLGVLLARTSVAELPGMELGSANGACPSTTSSTAGRVLRTSARASSSTAEEPAATRLSHTPWLVALSVRVARRAGR
ncbi:transposase [Streptomyces platensis]|uniref:transposase n=1 Tax=Streptomyces platensis TaxID=58346 RepID=UPI003F4CCC4D